MSLTIDLSADVEERLIQESRRQGVEVADLARQVIESAFSRTAIDEEQRACNQRAIALLRKWSEEGDEKEQRETLDALKEGLNESHSSYRKIFP